MVGYRSGIERNQSTMLPMMLDDYVDENHPCRVIDAFVDKLDLATRGFTHTQPQITGNPSYSPYDMLKLYVYGYLNRMRSSRRLEAETYRNIEVMWLIGSQNPDDKTICNFRKDNAKALKEVFRDFNKLCLSWGLFGCELESFDGTKVKANNSRKNYYTNESAKKALEKLEKRINEFLSEIDKNDATESEYKKMDSKACEATLKKLNDKKEKIELVLKEIKEKDEKGISVTDKDSALMKQSGGKGFDICYNIQTGVDSKHGLVADFNVTNHANDLCELSEMVERVGDILETRTFEALADKGYSNGKEIKCCEENGVTCYIPKPEATHQPEDAKYHRDNFKYEENLNIYICPEGNEMPQVRVRLSNGNLVFANRAACLACPQKDKCTKSKTLREIERNPYQEYADRAAANARENPEKYHKRQELSEHPYGILKHIWGFNQFLCRGKEKVTGETSLMFLAFNFRRALNILGTKKMIELLA